jgi:ribosome-associated protein
MRRDHVSDESDSTDTRPSKSQRKRDMHAVQKLGETLVALDAGRLGRIDLPESLRTAIVEAKRITAHEGRRRQLQYIGKLMRRVEPEAIQRQLDAVTGDSRAAVALMHRCERLRDALIADDDALTQLVAEVPQLDVQQLRTTIRSARRERTGGAAPKHARELYRLLHAALSEHHLDEPQLESDGPHLA